MTVLLTTGDRSRTLLFGACAVICLPWLAGCDGSKAESRKVFGQITFGDKPVESGHVRFVPVNGTAGSVSVAIIRNGEYKISARGGVPVGSHRVEIVALQKTGRKVKGKPPAAEIMVDEEVPIGPPAYRGESSPLAVTSADIERGEINFVIPEK